MKKFIVATLAVLYFGTSSGATVHMHYCMDRLVNWSFWHNDKKKDQCGHCGMKNSAGKGCCKDEHKQLKLDTDQKLVASSIQLAQFSALASTSHFSNYQDVIVPSIIEEYLTTNAPPRSKGKSLYLLNCFFRI